VCSGSEGGLVRFLDMTAEQKRQGRLSRLRHMEGSTFRLARYEAPSDEWDHDHCSACWAKFAEFDGPEIEHEGYCTNVPVSEWVDPPSPPIHDGVNRGIFVRQPSSGGFAQNWVCGRCFEDFREELGFKIEAP